MTLCRANGLKSQPKSARQQLVWLFVRHPGKVLTHRQLLTEVWEPKAVEQTHYLRVHIAHLREKIEEKPSHPELIITESAVGYRLLELESGLRPQCRKCVRIQV